MRLITAAGRNGGYYDKQRLVFVAEANPLGRVLSEDRAGSPRQFTAGDGSAVLRASFHSAFRSATRRSSPS